MPSLDELLEQDANLAAALDALPKVDSVVFSGPAPDRVQTAAINGGAELTPNLGETHRHLTLLDEPAERFLFCTFDDVITADGPKRGDKRLTKQFYGTLKQVAPRLAKLNQQGAGVFVLVNESNGPKRKREDITRLRTLWKEDDRGGTPPLPLEPHFVIGTSPGKRHEYLLIDGASVEGQEWEAVQARIVDDYGSDPDAKDRCRVLRLAGFYHMKNPETPHLVHIVYESAAQPYAWANVLKALPPADTREPEAPVEPGEGRKLPEARAALRWLDPDCEYGPWLQVGMALHHATNGGRRGLELWDAWSRGTLNPEHNAQKYCGSELLLYKWQSFSAAGKQTGQVTVATVFKWAHEAGWNNQITAEDCGLPAGYTLVDIDKLLIDDSIKAAIRTEDLPGNTDARLGSVMALIEARVTDGNIASVLLDQRNAIAIDDIDEVRALIGRAREELAKPVEEALAFFQDAKRKARENAGFALTDEALDHLLVLSDRNLSEFERIRAELRSGGASLKALAEAIMRRRSSNVANRRVTDEHGSETPPAWPYTAGKMGIEWHKTTEGGTVAVPLCNFHARIRTQIIHDDGTEERAAFEVTGTLRPSGKQLPLIGVPLKQYHAMAWVTANWGNEPIVYAGLSVRDNLRCAIQKLSRDALRQTIYGHIGWREIEGQWRYLHHDGALGAADNRVDIAVDVDTGAMQRYRLPEWDGDGDKLRAAIRASMMLLKAAPGLPELGHAALSCVYRAPTYTAACIDFALWLLGLTGAFKSELGAAMQAHYGEFTARDFCSCWQDTATDIEMKASHAKDAIFVVDDFKPVGKGDVDKLHAKADRIIRSAGNQSGRGRRNANLEARPTYHPRCLLVATGEDLPRGESLRGRMVIIEVKPGDISAEAITQLQHATASGQLALAMAGYVRWLAPRIEHLRRTLPEAIRAYREREDLAFHHARGNDNYGNLMEGLRLFATYATDMGAISEVERESLLSQGEAHLSRLMGAQAYYLKDADDVDRFLALLQAAFTMGRAHLCDHVTNGPPNGDPSYWGWRDATLYAPREALGHQIGWLADSAIYLDADAAFAAAQRLAHEQGHGFDITQRTLWQRMKDRGLLLVQESGKDERRLKVKQRVAGKPQWVIALPRRALEVVDDPCSQSSHSDGDQHDPSRRPGVWEGSVLMNHRHASAKPTGPLVAPYWEHWEQGRKPKRGAGFGRSAGPYPPGTPGGRTGNSNVTAAVCSQLGRLVFPVKSPTGHCSNPSMARVSGGVPSVPSFGRQYRLIVFRSRERYGRQTR